MKHIDPDYLVRSRSAFMREPYLTMADVKRAAEADTELGHIRRRDLVSAINRLQHLFQMPLDKMEATPRRMQSLFAATTAAKLNISEKTLANIRSLVALAMSRYARSSPSMTKRLPIDARWKELLEKIPTKFQRVALNRLATFCSVMNIRPDEVGRETLVGFQAALEAEEVVKSPRNLLTNTITNWNRSRRTQSNWPQITLTSPFKREPFNLSLSAFPKSFQDDVARWKDRMLRPDILDDDAPVRPIRSVTADFRVKEFCHFASALVRNGHLELHAVTGLAVLLEPSNFKAALRVFLERTGRTQRVHNLAMSMRLVGKHYCRLDEEVLVTLAEICRRLDPGNRRQMTERNRARLGQFDDPRKVGRLLQLPLREAAKAKSEKNPIRAAKRMECAVAVALLIHCGLRSRTLRSLELSDFSWIGKDKCQLYVAGHKNKTDRPLEFELESETASLVKKFVSEYRGRMPGAEGPYLFPGTNGNPRSSAAIYSAIMKTMRKRAGLDMNPHLFRHVLAKIAVEADPGAYLAVSRVLGHSTLTTTMAHYLGTESKAAGRQIDKLLAKVRTGER